MLQASIQWCDDSVKVVVGEKESPARDFYGELAKAGKENMDAP